MQGRIDFAADTRAATANIETLRRELETLRATNERLYGTYAGGIAYEKQAQGIRDQIGQMQRLVQQNMEGIRTIRSLGDVGAQSFHSITRGANSAQREIRHVVAAFDEISRGQRGAFFSTLGSALRDAGVSTGILVKGVGALAAIMVGARLVENTFRWSEELGKLAQRQIGFAAAVGMSNQDFAVFSDSMRLVGGNAEIASRAMELLQRRMEEAVKSPEGQVMNAFYKIGLDYDKLQQRLQQPGGEGLRATLRDMADSFVKMGNSAQRTAIFTQLIGTRQFAEMARYLQGGAQGIDYLTGRARELNQPTQQNIEHLAKIAEKIDGLGLAWEGYKASVVANGTIIGNVIDNITEKLKRAQEHGIIVGFFPRFGQQTGGGVSETVAPRPGHVFPYRGAGVPGPGEPGGYERPALPPMGLVPGGAIRGNLGGLSRTAGVNQNVLDWLSQAAAMTGQKVEISTGRAGHSLTTSTGGESEHAFGRAVDVYIIGPGGQRIPHGVGLGPGTPEYNAYKQLGDAYIAASRGQGRWGGYFSDPDIMHFGTIAPGFPAGARAPQYGTGVLASRIPQQVAPAAPISPALAEDQVLERVYLARLKIAEQAARDLHQDEKRQQFLKQEADFQTLAPDAKHKFLTENVKLTDAEAQQQQKMMAIQERQWSLQKDITQEQQSARLAQVQQQIVEAQRTNNTARVIELERERAKIISSDVYSTATQGIEAQTRVIEAQIGANRKNFELSEQAYSAQARANADIVRGAGAKAALGRPRVVSEIASTQAEIKALGEVTSREKESLRTLISMADAMGDNDAKLRVYWQQWDLGVKSETQALELLKKLGEESRKLADVWAKPFKQAIDSVGSSVEKTLKDLIFAQTSAQKTDAWRNLYKSITGAGIDLVGSIASKGVASMLGAQGGKGLGDFLGDKILGLLGLGQQSAQVANTAALTALTAAVSANTAALGVSSVTSTASAATSATGSVAGGAVSSLGFFAKIGSFLGFQHGGIVPSAAGGWVLPSQSGGIPMLGHAREMMLPEKLSVGMQNLIDSGGAAHFHAHFHGPSDATSVSRWFRDNLTSNASAVRDLFSNNHISVRSLAMGR